MKSNRNTPILIALRTFFITGWCATSALGGITLTNIPLADGNTANEGRAITWEGKWVVGFMGTNGMQYNAGYNAGYLYDVVTNTVYCPIIDSTPSAYSGTMLGVGYRVENGTNEVVITGGDIGYHANWMTPDGGATWGLKRRDTYGTIPTPCGQNALGAAGTSDVFYDAWIDANDLQHAWHCYVCKYSGAWPMTGTPTLPKDISQGQKGAMNGISASGRVVGSRQNAAGSTRNNWILDWNAVQPAQTFFKGLVADAPNNEGEAWSVSADGSVIFGISPLLASNAVKYGYRATFSGTTETGIARLPEFADTGGSDTRCWPFGCTPDGNYAVGMNYRGLEKAVVYDTSSPDTNKWTILDLSDLAAANGGLDIFGGNLRRAYSVGTNAAGELIITGRGYSPSDANWRAFVMTVPKWVAAIQFPISQSVGYGSNATFSLRTNGTDSLSYQWYKNGTVLSGETTTALSLGSVSCAGGQAGSYTVVVNNPSVSGVVTGAMTLTVLDPYISTQPSPTSRTNVEGTTVTYTISAGGAPTLSYKWQRDGVDLTDGPTGWGSTIAGSTTTTLTISNVTPSDAASAPGYRAVLTTSAGGCTTTSTALKLAVVQRPVLSSIEAFPGYYRLNVSGPGGQTYNVLYSTNLALPLNSWTPLVTNTFGGGPEVYDDSAPPESQRFYILASPAVITP